MMKTSIPTTVVSGTLGAGKTTLILNLIKQLPDDYQVLWLKNEYGDTNIDSELASESNIATKEILNGCICCVLIGKLHNALEEIVQTMQPQRLIIETAGTAYPYPIVAEIAGVEGIKLDGLITVVDAANFDRFKDKSVNAKRQAKYVDLIVVNKTKLVEEDQLEMVLDEVYDLYSECPKIQTDTGFVSSDLLVGLDSNLAGENLNFDHHHHPDEVDTLSFDFGKKEIDLESLEAYLSSLPKEDFFRIKGIINTADGAKLLNYVLGKVDWSDLESYKGSTKIVFMGRGITSAENIIKQKVTNTLTN